MPSTSALLRNRVGWLVAAVALLWSLGSHPSPAGASQAATTRTIALGVSMIPWDTAALDNFTASVDGHTPALWGIWNDWGGSKPEFPSELAQAVAARGAVPMVWWQPVTTGNLNDTTFTNERIIKGDFDVYIRQWARAAKSFGDPVVLRLAHEMDGNWFPWGINRNGNTAANFKDAWRHVWDIFRGPGGEDATNVRFLWSPYAPNASLYPGAGYVDYVGFTALNWAGAQNQPWRSMSTILSGPVAGSRQFDKPIIVAELASNPNGGSKANWILAGYTAAYDNYPEIKAIVYFNVDTSPGQPDWRLTTPPDALTAYRAVLADPRFQGRLGASPSPTSTPSATPTQTPSPSLSPTPSPTPSETPSPSATPTQTPSPSPSPTPSPSPDATPPPTAEPTPSPHVSLAPTPTPATSPTASPSPTPTATISPTATPSVTPTPTPIPLTTPTLPAEPTAAPTATPTLAMSPTPIPSPHEATAAPSPSPTLPDTAGSLVATAGPGSSGGGQAAALLLIGLVAAAAGIAAPAKRGRQ